MFIDILAASLLDSPCTDAGAGAEPCEAIDFCIDCACDCRVEALLTVPVLPIPEVTEAAIEPVWEALPDR